jgi:hypothetical protein
MTLEFFLIVMGVALFGGLFAGLALAYRDVDDKRTKASAANKVIQPAPALYQWRARDEALAQELMFRQLEHYLRRETMMAERFIANPTPQTLRAGDQQHLGTC